MNVKYSVFIIGIILVLITALVITGCMSTMREDELLTDSSLSDIKEKGVLRIGTDPNFPPMRQFDESGELVGVDIDIIHEIADSLGVKTKFVPMEWADLFDSVKNKEVDVIIAAITITPARQEEMLFSIPYFDAGQVIVVRKNYELIKSSEDLQGKKIGVLEGTTCEQAAMDYAEAENVVRFDDNDKTILALKNNEIDAMVSDYIGASGFVKLNPDLKIVGEPFTQEFYGIATNKDNVALMNEINQILGTMIWGGRIKEITDKWIK